jgi:hypothetical protein
MSDLTSIGLGAAYGSAVFWQANQQYCKLFPAVVVPTRSCEAEFTNCMHAI